MLVRGIAYGGDYNPEQWPDSYLQDDIRLMKEAGVSVVTLGVFSWSSFEPEQDRFEFDRLSEVMDALHSAGIGIDLATGTASPPSWLSQQFPSTLPTTADGVRLAWGSRQQYNPNSAVYRERTAALVTALASRFANHPGLVAWHVNNEYGCHVWESFDDESAGRFRAWLANRYDSLDNLNRAWGTEFWSQRITDWDQVIPPRTTPTLHNPHRLDDWRRFCSDSLLELYLIERDILRAANPAVPITTNFMGLFFPVDYWKWAEHLDFVSNDSYPDPADPRAAREFAFDCDLMRSLGKGKPFIQMEQVTSAVQWRNRNAAKRPGQYRLWSIMAVALGADGILNFQWRQSLAGAETFHGAMVPHAGRASRTWTEVVGLGSDLGELSHVQGHTLSNKVAIVWDWENAWAYANAVGPTNEAVPENAARDWHATFFELGLSVDFVHPSQDLTSYAVVIVPSLFRLTVLHARRLHDACASGTHLVVSHLTGYVDERGHATEGGYLAGLRDILGVTVTDYSARAIEPAALGSAEQLAVDVDRISSSVGTPAADTRVDLEWMLTGYSGAARNWAESVRIDKHDVETIARFDTADAQAQVAVTVRRSPGHGSAWYIATELDGRARRSITIAVLGERGIEVDFSLPAGVQRLERGGVAFVLNHGDQTVKVEGTDVPPRGLTLRAAVTREPELAPLEAP